MLDHWSTQFLEVQRETYRGAIGREDYDRRTYAVLHGDGSDEPAPRKGRAVLVAAAASAAGVIGAAVWVMVSLSS